ncbi:MAG: type II toxin-antitoxin system VapC family toxin [Bosea sp.]|nr:VapC toxin family PIN domain ribonuclease [Methylobacterium sp.]MBR3193090.1 type II toxin-antitoxin system VapC family toxin [Bosea sp. (in: a-proteobacteria)]
MYVDASAIVAMILSEPDAADLASALDGGDAAITSPLAIYEASLAIARVNAIPAAIARDEIHLTLTRMSIAIAPIDASQGDIAVSAFDRFGKGRHPAALNMGDCFAYACAAVHDARILFKGQDFSQTDLPSARSGP